MVRRLDAQSVEHRAQARADRPPVLAPRPPPGCVAFAIGTETRGSIISPSAINGVVGLRPTYGRVSRYGAMALSWTMDKIGPMCRSVEDCVVVLNAIYGGDGKDDTALMRRSGNVPLSTPPSGGGRQARTTARRSRSATSRRNSRAAAVWGGSECRPTRSAERAFSGRNGDTPRRSTCSARPARSSSRWRCRTSRAEAIGFVLSAEARGGVRRSDAQQGNSSLADRSVTGRLAEHLPQLALHSGGRIHPRHARAAAIDAGDGQADVAVRRLPESRAWQQQPAGDQPDRSSRDRAEERLYRQTCRRRSWLVGSATIDEATVCRVALSLRTSDRVAQPESYAVDAVDER